MEKKTIASLDMDNTALLIIDYQKKLFPLVFNHEDILGKASLMIRFAQLKKLPMMVTEQYPDGLGKTVKEIRSLLKETDTYRPWAKTCFNCFREEKIAGVLKNSRRKNLLVCGIETHICVLQTVLSALDEGFNVFLLADCVGSRDALDHSLGMMQAEAAGAVLTTVETVVYQMLERSDSSEFKEALEIIKGQN